MRPDERDLLKNSGEVAFGAWVVMRPGRLAASKCLEAVAQSHEREPAVICGIVRLDDRRASPAEKSFLRERAGGACGDNDADARAQFPRSRDQTLPFVPPPPDARSNHGFSAAGVRVSASVFRVLPFAFCLVPTRVLPAADTPTPRTADQRATRTRLACARDLVPRQW